MEASTTTSPFQLKLSKFRSSGFAGKDELVAEEDSIDVGKSYASYTFAFLMRKKVDVILYFYSDLQPCRKYPVGIHWPKNTLSVAFKYVSVSCCSVEERWRESQIVADLTRGSRYEPNYRCCWLQARIQKYVAIIFLLTICPFMVSCLKHLTFYLKEYNTIIIYREKKIFWGGGRFIFGSSNLLYYRKWCIFWSVLEFLPFLNIKLLVTR